MPSVSQSQQRFFGYLKSHPDEAAAKGISPKTVEEFASTPRKGLPVRVAKPAMGYKGVGE